MLYITKHAVAVAGLHAADWLKLWCAQFDSVQRYCETLNDVTAASRSGWKAPSASTAGEDHARTAVRPGHADLAVRDLLECWRRMYQTAVLYDALKAMQPHAAQLIQERIEEFHDGLAAAQVHGESESE